ncbi:MAG: hypothetical protein HKL88_06755 [Bacteroidia bacterium]|nr:hypothetical protein [Bacteroidia bacterium]
MDKEQMVKLIEDTYSTKNKTFVTRVTCTDNVTHYGYFHPFDDYAKLKEKNIYRFVPRNNYAALKSGYEKKWKYDAKHSIILQGEDVLNIDFVLPLHN